MQTKCVRFYLQVIVASYGYIIIPGRTLASSQVGDRGQHPLRRQVGMKYRTKLHPHGRVLLNTQRDPDDAPDEEPRTVSSGLFPPEEQVTVAFGILVKAFYGIDFVEGTFTTDSVIVASWKDTGNAKLIPKGEKQLRLSQIEAEAKIWLPDIQVSNVAQDGVHIISTSFLIEPGGMTTKVERALYTTEATFEYASFPFDKQVLEIRLASTTYMDDQVALTPIGNASLWGVTQRATQDDFESWLLANSSIFTTLDTDGFLSKSRGILQLVVKRPVGQFTCVVFVPSVMLVAMSWSSLWLPLTPPYAMPRIGLNCFGLLAQVTMATHVASMTPPGKLTWLDEYLASCFILQFILLVQNITVLMAKHHLSEGSYADKMSFRLLLSFPFVWALTLIVQWESADNVPLVIGVTMLLYVILYCYEYYIYAEEAPDGTQSEAADSPKSTTRH